MLKALHGLVTWLDICDGNMAEGSFRVDANVSVRQKVRPSSVHAVKSKTSTLSASWNKPSIMKWKRKSKILEDGGSTAGNHAV